MDSRPSPGQRLTGFRSNLKLAILLIFLAAVAVYGYLHRGTQPAPLGAPAAEMPAAAKAWRQEAFLATGLSAPRGVATDPPGNVAVVGDRSVMALRPGQAPQTLATLDAEPICLAADGRGGWVVGLRDGVRLLDAQGRETRRWLVEGRRSWVTSVAVAGDAVLVADAGDRVVLHYSTQGKLLGRLGEKDPARGVPGLLVPSPHLDVVWREGDLWVSNPGRRRVEQYAPDGRLLSAWGKAGVALEDFCGCCNPTDLALLPDGKVVTAEKGLARVKVYTPEGALESVVALPEDLSRNTVGLDLATDEHGRIFVLDGPARAVRVFARQPADDRGSEPDVTRG
jgi:DNA-binding beta-propeller fold protein YncE